MTVIFLFPLFFSIASVAGYWLVGESLAWKIIATVWVAVSVALQFVPGIEVHFLIPLAMQLVTCVVFAIYWQASR